MAKANGSGTDCSVVAVDPSQENDNRQNQAKAQDRLDKLLDEPKHHRLIQVQLHILFKAGQLFPGPPPKQQRQQQGYQQAGSQGKVEPEVLPLDDDVAR